MRKQEAQACCGNLQCCGIGWHQAKGWQARSRETQLFAVVFYASRRHGGKCEPICMWPLHHCADLFSCNPQCLFLLWLQAGKAMADRCLLHPLTEKGGCSVFLLPGIILAFFFKCQLLMSWTWKWQNETRRKFTDNDPEEIVVCLRT